MKKMTLHSEIAYIVSLLILSFAVAMVTVSDFGLSAIVAPAYILSEAVDFLTFGQAEYVIQGVLFIVFCFLMKKVKVSYFVAFLTCVIYGAALDLWRLVIPVFNPEITPVGSVDTWVRITFFAVGVILTSLSIAFCFKAYIPPQVCDYFVKGVTLKYKLNTFVFKTLFDIGYLTVALILSFSIFGKLVGVNFGTVIIAIVNGYLINAFSKLLDKIFVVKPIFKKAYDFFALDGETLSEK